MHSLDKSAISIIFGAAVIGLSPVIAILTPTSRPGEIGIPAAGPSLVLPTIVAGIGIALIVYGVYTWIKERT